MGVDAQTDVTMQAHIQDFFAGEVAAFTGALAELQSQVDPAAEPQDDGALQRLTEAIHDSRNACRRTESILAGNRGLLVQTQGRFQQAIAPWFDQSWFMHRARTKPRGYPGDYELLSAIYDGVPKSRGLGGYLDRYFLQTTLAKAVVGRLKAARSFLIDEIAQRRGEVTVLNVACGPCREYLGGLGQPEHCHIHITCVDNDQLALDYVQAHVVPVAGIPDIRCACYNALRMCSADATIKKFGRSDVIYSVGLCDYIPDRMLVAMLRGWRESLNEGGVVYVAFKDAQRYDKTEYQWHVDWHFFQRTEQDCRNLFEQAGYDMDALEMTREETGVIMNFISRPGARRILRVDVPAQQAAEVPSPTPTPATQSAGPKVAS